MSRPTLEVVPSMFSIAHNSCPIDCCCRRKSRRRPLSPPPCPPPSASWWCCGSPFSGRSRGGLTPGLRPTPWPSSYMRQWFLSYNEQRPYKDLWSVTIETSFSEGWKIDTKDEILLREKGGRGPGTRFALYPAVMVTYRCVSLWH